MPAKKIKTRSVKQKCFESIMKSIQHLYKPKIKVTRFEKKKTDKSNTIITIIYSTLPVL